MSDESGGFRSVAGVLKDAVTSSLKHRIRDRYDQLMEQLEARLLKIHRRMLRSLGIAALAFVAVGCFFLAGTFYMIDVLHVSRAGAFLALAGAFSILLLLLYVFGRKKTL